MSKFPQRAKKWFEVPKRSSSSSRREVPMETFTFFMDKCFIPNEILRDVFYFIPDADICQLWMCSRTILLLLEPRLKIKNQQAEERIRMLARKVDRLVRVIVQDYFRNCVATNDTNLTPGRLEVLLQKTEADEQYITGYWGELLAAV